MTGEINQMALPWMARHLKDNITSFASFFVNFKSECTKYASDLDDLLALASMSLDVVQIHDDMDRINSLLFCDCLLVHGGHSITPPVHA